MFVLHCGNNVCFLNGERLRHDLHFCLKILLPLSGLQHKQDALTFWFIQAIRHGRHMLVLVNLTHLPKIDLCHPYGAGVACSAFWASGNVGMGGSKAAASKTEGSGQIRAWGTQCFTDRAQVVRASPCHRVKPFLASHQQLSVPGHPCRHGAGLYLRDSSPQLSRRDQDVCLWLLFVSIWTEDIARDSPTCLFFLH